MIVLVVLPIVNRILMTFFFFLKKKIRVRRQPQKVHRSRTMTTVMRIHQNQPVPAKHRIPCLHHQPH